MKFNISHPIKISSVIFVCLQLLNFYNLRAQDETIKAKPSIEFHFSDKDSNKIIKAIVTSESNGKINPVKGVELHFYIKKSFGLLPIAGENTITDQTGIASVDFPKDMPGDSLGNVTIMAKVEGDEKLGNLVITKVVQWGKPVSYTSLFHQRALWASGKNAPVPLVIIVSSMVAGAWSVIIYIIYQLIQINKPENYEIEN